MTRANAITFTGGTNSLTLAPGSTITGRVVAFSTADILALGGSGSASFDVSQIGASAQYQGFGAFQKTGASTWTLTGTNLAAMSWILFHARLHHPLGNGRKHRHVQQPHHIRPACRIHGKPELHRDRRSTSPARSARSAPVA